MTSASNQDNDKPSILVVDDSRVVRVSLKNILQRRYEIIEADDGDKAWMILQENPAISLVFSDLAMPKLDGRELLRKLRLSDDEKIRNLPFIVITGREENQEIRSQLIDEGANDLVTKPFDAKDIVEHVKIYTSKQSVARQQDPLQDEELLSGISNKVVFSQNARKRLSFAIRNKNELALLLLQFDQFEKIKQHYSDPAIEHILITTAEIIRSYTRIEDIVGYFGEGTYAILFPAANSVGTKHLGRKILSDLHSKKFYLGESDSTVTASIGVSAPDIKPGITFSDLFRLAEQRLKAAVNAGGNRVVDKGNATITPVSTLFNDSPEMQSENQELSRQTEISMRKLAEQEALKKRGGNEHGTNTISTNDDIDKINDALLVSEYENGLLKEEVFRLQKQNEDFEQLRKQLHETDALQQQTRLKLQQLKSEYEEMHKRAETAESNQNQLMETENDRSIIEQHLLQETELIQTQLNKANEQIDKSTRAYKASETELSNLKEQLKKQKKDFEIELADAHMMHSTAENKLADLEKQLLDGKKETNPFNLTATPTITPIEKRSENGINSVSKQLLIEEVHHNAPSIIPVQQKRKTPLNTSPEKPKISWPFRILFLTICVLLGIVSFRVWDGLSLQKTGTQENNIKLNITAKPFIQDALRKRDADKKPEAFGERKITPNSSTYNARKSAVGIKTMQSQQQEEAKLQAAFTLRQMAEEEFLLLSEER